MFVPGIVVGAFAGGALSKFINNSVLLWMFVFFLIALGARMVYSYWEKGGEAEKPPVKLSTSTHVLIVIFSFVVGIISGLLGIGGGILIVPFMTYILKYPTKSAAGSSHLIISFSALAGIMGHATSHRLDIPLIASTGIAVTDWRKARSKIQFKSETGNDKSGSRALDVGSFRSDSCKTHGLYVMDLLKTKESSVNHLPGRQSCMFTKNIKEIEQK